jgi:hypothetical protein
MPKLKIGSIEDDKPVSLTVKLPAMVYRDLTAYAEILKREGRQSTADPAMLVGRCWHDSWQRIVRSGSCVVELNKKVQQAPPQNPSETA